MKVYIVGAVAGIDNWEQKFLEAKEELLALGCTVLCPLDYPPGLTLKEYMILSIANVFLSDKLYVLPGYEDSLGTNTEITVAKSFGLPITFKRKELLN